MRKIKKVINGIEYQAVWKGINFIEECTEKCTLGSTEIISQEKLADIIFSEIIVSPKVAIDDFTDKAEFLQVYEFGQSVLFGNFEKRLTKSQAKGRVQNNWAAYRLVLSNCGFDYNTVFHSMTPHEIELANIALDLKIAAEKKAVKKKR